MGDPQETEQCNQRDLCGNERQACVSAAACDFAVLPELSRRPCGRGVHQQTALCELYADNGVSRVVCGVLVACGVNMGF